MASPARTRSHDAALGALTGVLLRAATACGVDPDATASDTDPVLSMAADAATPLPHVEFFATARVARSATIALPSDGDLWPSCWSDDGHLYAAWGDGRGFDLTLPARSDIGVARISGSPRDGSLRGENLALGDAVGQVWSGGTYNRKPTGMACVDGDLYLAVQDLALDFDDAPAATIARSRDKGRTWEWDRSAPMFRDHALTTLFFLDTGDFDTLALEVRHEGSWRALAVTPLVTFAGWTSGAHRQYAFTFDTLSVDGVRVVGKPRGSRGCTSIAELSVRHDVGPHRGGD